MNISLLLPFPRVKAGNPWRIGNNPYVEIPNVVLGATVTEEFSETLDSASVVIAHVPEDQRLSDLVPYQEAVLKCGSFSHSFLVDEFEETKEAVDRQGKVYFSYTISLMSRTKYLEKVQLPNLCVTHSKERQTIAHYIGLWLGLYLPRIKVANYDGTGKYRYVSQLLLSTDAALTEEGGIFDVPCADLQLSKPTLRQALTALMSQVGCIPAVKGDKVSFLNLREEQAASPLQDDPSVIVSRSCSSGSFVNRLVNQSGNLIDDSGVSVSERLKFSDRDNLLLKNLENLKLETRFPIYKVQSLIMNAFFGGTTINVYPLKDSPGKLNGEQVHTCFCMVGMQDDGEASFAPWFPKTDYVTFGFGSANPSRAKMEGTLYRIAKDEGSFSYSWKIMERADVSCESSLWDTGDFRLMNGTNNLPKNFFANTENRRNELIVFVGRCSLRFAGNSDGWDIDGQPICVVDGMKYRYYDGVASEDKTLYGLYFGDRNADGSIESWYGNIARSAASGYVTEGAYRTGYALLDDGLWCKFQDDANDAAQLDITPITFDETVRQGLSMDFVELTGKDAPLPLSELAKYYYSTVGYQVGGNEISGFSQDYTETNGWWDVQKSAAEMLCSVAEGWVSRYETYTADDANDMFQGVFGDYLSWIGENRFSYREGTWSTSAKGYSINFSGDRTPVTPWGDGYTYATLFFDVNYRPIASPVLKFTGKTDAQPLPIEQMDSKQNGLSSVEAVSNSEYDTVERLTSDALAIYQRTSDEMELSPLNSKFEYAGNAYTIFKRVLSFNGGFIEANYYASRDYVIKNFYTSIATKYRAYQYVDLSEATERHENVCDCLLLSSDGFRRDTARFKAEVGGQRVYGALFDGICTLAKAGRKWKWSGTENAEWGYAGGSSSQTLESTMGNARAFLTIDLPKPSGISASCRLWDGEISGNDEKWIQDECAISHSDRFVAFTALDFDNASEGLYISPYYVKSTGSGTTSQKLGGIPQQWYPAQSGDNPYGAARLSGFEFASELEYYLKAAPFDDVMELPRMVGSPGECGAANVLSLGVGDLLFEYFEKDGAERFALTAETEIANETGGNVEYTEGMVSKSTLASASRRSAYYEYIDGKECVCIGVWRVNVFAERPFPSWKEWLSFQCPMQMSYSYDYVAGDPFPYKGSVSFASHLPAQLGARVSPDEAFLRRITEEGKIGSDAIGTYAALYVGIDEYDEAVDGLCKATSSTPGEASVTVYAKPLLRVLGEAYLNPVDDKSRVAYVRDFGMICPAYEVAKSADGRPMSNEVVPLAVEE